jgi:hypothetical protein
MKLLPWGTGGERTGLDAPEVVTCFTEFGAYERHFNDMQARYRALASTWLLAAIAGIGFILTNDLQLSVDRFLLVAGIAVAAAFGVTLLWQVDLIVYQGLLEAAFLAGLVLEEEHPEIGEMRLLMLANVGGGSAAPRVVYFYIGCAGALLLTALVAIAVAAFGDIPPVWSAVLVLLALGIGIGWLWSIFWYTNNKASRDMVKRPEPGGRTYATYREYVHQQLMSKGLLRRRPQ